MLFAMALLRPGEPLRCKATLRRSLTEPPGGNAERLGRARFAHQSGRSVRSREDLRGNIAGSYDVQATTETRMASGFRPYRRRRGEDLNLRSACTGNGFRDQIGVGVEVRRVQPDLMRGSVVRDRVRDCSDA